jgi:transposase IS116/IS110/IS902 family protein
VDDLERQLAVIDRELGPVARSDQRVQLLVTIPGLGELLGLTIAAEIGEVARFQSARKLIGYAGLAPTIKQSGQSSWTGRISKAGSPTLRWAAIEAAQHSWRPTNPWNRLYTPDQTPARQGQPREGRDRAQSADRLLARPLASAAIQTPRINLPQHPSRQAPRRSGRLTAQKRLEKPGQLKPTICAAKRRKRTQQP